MTRLKFNHERRRVDWGDPKPVRDVTASDIRDLAAAQAKRERKAAKGIHAS